MARLKPHAAGAETVALVNGQRETVLANAQILRGKLARAHNSPVRDVFDIICAAKADPRGLATAAGTLNGPVMPTKMAIAIETMAKHRQTGVLYDSNRPETTDQIAFPNKHFEPGWKPFTERRSDRRSP